MSDNGQGTQGRDISLETINIENIDLGSADFDINKERFALARWILLYLFILIAVLILFRLAPEHIEKDSVKELFNTVFQSVIPIASLIIGYYFGSNGKD